MTIAIDFEGVIYDPNTNKEVQGAGAALRRLRDKGHRVILWTSLSNNELLWAVDWILKNDMPIRGVPVPAKGVDVSPRKIQADIYVESKVVGGFPGWKKVEEYIESLTVRDGAE